MAKKLGPKAQAEAETRKGKNKKPKAKPIGSATREGQEVYQGMPELTPWEREYGIRATELITGGASTNRYIKTAKKPRALKAAARQAAKQAEKKRKKKTATTPPKTRP